MMKIFKLKLLALICMLGFALNAWADQLPGYYPEKFDNKGVIDRIDLSKNQVVIFDELMRFASITAVHSPNTQFASLRDLRQGMKVGFSTNNIGGKESISEVWILPQTR